MMNSRQNIAVPRVADYNQLFKQPSVINPYFLTQQSANLIEDFVREIDRGSSLFLLYGESGVGKSSLLHQIRDKRLADINTHWIDFNKTSTRAVDETMSDSIGLAEELKTLAEKAEVGDVIFVDHFEVASNREQHQIFESWSIDGRDKQLNLIVASASSSFTIFQQLARQMQIEARSFQLMPCNQVEAETYVQSVLFPEEPFAKMSMSHSLKKQLHACNGVFASLTEFAEHEAGQIVIDKQVSEKSNAMAGAIIGVLLLVIIVAGYLFYSTHITDEPIEVEITQDLSHEVPSKSASLPIAPEPQIEAQTDQLDQKSEQVEVAKEPGEVSVQPSKPAETPETKVAEVETVVEAEVEAEVETKVNWFQSMQNDSKKWIKNGSNKSGTIQIMSVGFDRFTSDAFEKYMQKLQSKNVDVTQLHIFQTKANDQKIYTIVYGEYPSRREAGLQIKALPKALVAANPFPRTIGGISREIEKIRSE